MQSTLLVAGIKFNYIDPIIKLPDLAYADYKHFRILFGINC